MVSCAPRKQASLAIEFAEAFWRHAKFVAGSHSHERFFAAYGLVRAAGEHTTSRKLGWNLQRTLLYDDCH